MALVIFSLSKGPVLNAIALNSSTIASIRFFSSGVIPSVAFVGARISVDRPASFQGFVIPNPFYASLVNPRLDRLPSMLFMVQFRRFRYPHKDLAVFFKDFDSLNIRENVRVDAFPSL